MSLQLHLVLSPILNAARESVGVLHGGDGGGGDGHAGGRWFGGWY
jgi:hypothetical protein